MLSKFSTVALAATLSLAGSAAIAGAGDYAFEPVNPEMKKGDDVTLAVRLTNKQTGKPVAGAVIFKTRVDMAPDGMAEMESPVAPLPSKEPGGPPDMRTFLLPRSDYRIERNWDVFGLQGTGSQDIVVERAFVLYPLADIAADIVHPVLNRRIDALRDEVPGRETVVRIAETL